MSAIDTPQIRPGLVQGTEPMRRVLAFFRNSASGNLVIQLVTGLGAPAERLGVTPPDLIKGGQGMLLSIACPDDKILAQVEKVCRQNGAEIHRAQR